MSSELQAPTALALAPLRESTPARFTGGLSPRTLTPAAADRARHLAGAPGRYGLER